MVRRASSCYLYCNIYSKKAEIQQVSESVKTEIIIFIFYFLFFACYCFLGIVEFWKCSNTVAGSKHDTGVSFAWLDKIKLQANFPNFRHTFAFFKSSTDLKKKKDRSLNQAFIAPLRHHCMELKQPSVLLLTVILTTFYHHCIIRHETASAKNSWFAGGLLQN